MNKTLVPILALLLAVASAAFAAEPIQLEFKAPAQPIKYTLSSDAKSVFSLYGLEKLIVQSSETTFTYAKGADTKDGIGIDCEVLDQVLTNDGQPVPETEKGDKVSLVLSAAGNLLKSSNTRALVNFQDMILSLPAKPVKVGDAWTNEVPMQLPDGAGGQLDTKAKIECAVTDVKPFQGVNCVWIATKLVIEAPKSDKNEMKALATGTVYFDPVRGVIVGHKNELALKLDVFNYIQEKKVLFTSLDLKMSVKLLVAK